MLAFCVTFISCHCNPPPPLLLTALAGGAGLRGGTAATTLAVDDFTDSVASASPSQGAGAVAGGGVSRLWDGSGEAAAARSVGASLEPSRVVAVEARKDSDDEEGDLRTQLTLVRPLVLPLALSLVLPLVLPLALSLALSLALLLALSLALEDADEMTVAARCAAMSAELVCIHALLLSPMRCRALSLAPSRVRGGSVPRRDSSRADERARFREPLPPAPLRP